MLAAILCINKLTNMEAQAFSSIMKETNANDRRRNLTRYFRDLSGGDADNEAFTNRLFGNAQARKTVIDGVNEVTQAMEVANKAVQGQGSNPGENIAKLARILFDAGLVKSFTKIVQVEFNAEVESDGGKHSWNTVYYTALNAIAGVIAALTYGRKISNNAITSVINHVVSCDTVEACVKIIDLNVCRLATTAAVFIINNIVKHSHEAKERFTFSGGIPKYARFITWDNWAKIFNSWYKKGPGDWALSCIFKKGSGFDIRNFTFPVIPEQVPKDALDDIVCRWIMGVKMYALETLKEVAGMNDRMRKLIANSPSLMQAIMDLYHLVVFHFRDERILDSVGMLLETMCLSESVGVMLDQEYDILKSMETLLLTPVRSSLWHHLGILNSLVLYHGECRRKVLDNKVILNLVILYCSSMDQGTVKAAFSIMVHLTSGPEGCATILGLGFGAQQLVTLHDYNDAVNLSDSVAAIARNMETHAAKAWKKETDSLTNTVYKFDIHRAGLLKNEGNDCYKRKDYNSAIQKYTEAIEICPISLKTPDSNNMSAKKLYVNSKVDENKTRIGSWNILLATLYSNRAQCHLSLKMYDKVIEDATHAIAKTHEDQVDALTMHCKSAHRRGTAYLELQEYRKALQDSGSLAFVDINNKAYRSLFVMTYIKYREKHGYGDTLKRCLRCFKGEGIKLKKCSKCGELYCSQKCQMKDWKNGHKDVCTSREIGQEEKQRGTEDVEEEGDSDEDDEAWKEGGVDLDDEEEGNPCTTH